MRTIGTPSTQARKLNAIASGALPNGDPVVVNSDGTVSVVAGAAEGIGTPNVFGSGGTTTEISSTYDPVNNKFVVFYRQSGQSGYAIVGSASGSSITFGTPVQFKSSNVGSTKCTYDVASGKVVVFYADPDSSNYGTARVGTISGTSISFGTAVVFQSSETTYIYPQYEANQQRTVVAYTDSTDSNQGFVKSGQVSGTSISFGSRANYSTSGTYDKALIYDSSQQKMLLFYGSFNGFTARSRVVTVSGSSVSFGSEVLVTSGTAQEVDGYYDTSINKPVIIWKDSGNSDYGTGIVATISGTSVSFGTKYVFNSANTTYLAAAYDSTNNVGLIAYSVGSPKTIAVTNVTATGTALAYSTPLVTSEHLANKQIDIIYDDNAEKSVITSINNSTNEFGQSFTYAAGSTNLTSENYIGLSSNGYPDTAGATIDVQGAINDRQSGLTAGQSYYVQTDGTLGTTPADPSVFAGTAISATKMIVKG